MTEIAFFVPGSGSGPHRRWGAAGIIAAALALTACGSSPPRATPGETGAGSGAVAGGGLPCAIPSPTLKRGGAYYLDDGPGSDPPANLSQVPDAIPRPEPLRAANMKPYEALGKRYTPMTELRPYKAKGLASWYGRRYHGQKTASGETYDMYAMTAAHPTLPIPSYVRVTNLSSGRSVVVRINDRGPFHSDRVIDLSFTAACKLELLAGGSGLVEVEAIMPGETPPPQTADAPMPEESRLRPVAMTASPADGVDGAPAVAATERDQILTALANSAPPAAPGIYLQLGAFGSRENADNFLAHIRPQLPWLGEALALSHKDGLYRVQAGPYASVADARLSADRIAPAIGFKPMVTSR